MNKFMEEANNLALENIYTNAGGPFGAVVVKDKKIVGKGNNNVLKNNDPTAHAEVMAIRDACKNLNTYDLKGCILYTSCYPCPMCLSAIVWANIDMVYYGNTKDDAEDIGFRDKKIYELLLNIEQNKILKLEMLNREETIKTFKAFKEKKDGVIY